MFNAGGISTLMTQLLDNWIAPAFIFIVAAISLTFLFKRQFRELATFAIIAAVAGAMIFFGIELFGKNGTFSTLAKDGAQTINTITPVWLTHAKTMFIGLL